MSVQYAYACLIMDGYKTGESRNTMHVANRKGLFIALYAQQRSEDWDATEMMEMLRELWPGCQTRHWRRTERLGFSMVAYGGW